MASPRKAYGPKSNPLKNFLRSIGSVRGKNVSVARERQLPKADRSTASVDLKIPLQNAGLKQAVPLSHLVEVRVVAGRPLWARAPGAVDPSAPSALPTRLELGLSIGPGLFLLSGPIALLTRDLFVSVTLWATLHRGTTSVAQGLESALALIESALALKGRGPPNRTAPSRRCAQSWKKPQALEVCLPL